MGIRLLYFLVITVHTDPGTQVLQSSMHRTLQTHCSNVRGHKIIKMFLTSYLLQHILCQMIRSEERSEQAILSIERFNGPKESDIQTEDAFLINMRRRGLN